MRDYIIAFVIFLIVVAMILCVTVVDYRNAAKADELLDDPLVNGKYITQGLYPAKWFPENHIFLRYDGTKYAIIEVTDEFGKTWGHWQWKLNPGDKVMVYIPDGMYLNVTRGELTIIDDMTWMEVEE